ncbi:MAG: formylglycine-generating enzyme family protein [Bacteroidetes bacterium]|nr:formylglycine-generating enzyme family protein [Bacteroidota bacterium]
MKTKNQISLLLPILLLFMVGCGAGKKIVQTQDKKAPETDPSFQPYEQNIPGTEVNFKMTPIPGGEFLLGSAADSPGHKEDERPQVKVKIDPFWMGVHEVSFDQYMIFREKELDTKAKEEGWNPDAITRPSPPYEDPTFGMGKDGFPATSMTNYAAMSYCKWLTRKTGVFYRLPTEAEWEYACKAGTTTQYSFGDDASMLGEYAWYAGNSGEAFQKIMQKKPNQWGLYDMHGNVAEWTMDQYVEDFFATLQAKQTFDNPASLPLKLHPRTVKGGSWADGPEDLRSAARLRSNLDWKRRDPQIPKSFWWNTDSPFVGFRLVAPKNQPSPEELQKFWSRHLDDS